MKTFQMKNIVESHKFNKSAGECLIKLAQYVSIILSADKGIPNEIQKVNNNKYLVVTDSGDAVELKY